MTDINEIIGNAISVAITDGQNQIHDLRDKKATPEDIEKRMMESFNFHFNKVTQTLEQRDKEWREKLNYIINDIEKSMPSHDSVQKQLAYWKSDLLK